MAALTVDFHLEQGADWPGEEFYIVDAAGNPKSLASPMVASGTIADPATGTVWLTWSNNPAAGQGLVLFQNNLFIPTVAGPLTTAWTWAVAQYQLYLYDPNGPVGDQTIRVGQGAVYLSRQL